MKAGGEKQRDGERRVTAKEVAEAAGVSISAVSRAFTKGASVSAQTREKVLRATRKLGYQPNVLARSLMTGRTELIGLVSDNFENPDVMETIDLFTRRLQQHGRRPLLANLAGGARTEVALDMLLQYNVDGVILASSTMPPELADLCSAARLPVVQAFGRSGGKTAVPTVGADDLQGGELAAELLVDSGYRKMAFLGGPQLSTSTEDRLVGFRKGLRKRDLRPVAEVFGHAYSHDAGMTLMRQIVKTGGVDAVFCGDDILAMGALDYCREAGISVPGTIGVVGFNDIVMAAWPAYNLTTIRQPLGEIIIAAVEIVLGIVDQAGPRTETRLFECQVVKRGTLRSA